MLDGVRHDLAHNQYSSRYMRHTKIIATVGPASDSDAMLDALIAAGTDIFRLNFSHGTHESQAATYARVREAAQRARREVAILQDLGGPKIRTGRLEGGRPIRAEGRAIRFASSTGDVAGGPGRVFTTFDGLARACGRAIGCCWPTASSSCASTQPTAPTFRRRSSKVGRSASTRASTRRACRCRRRRSRRRTSTTCAFGLSLGVDMVALSFVQSAADLRQARQLMAEAGAADVPLVAKLERPQALEHLDEILDACDAVMVARGDLGLEMPLERVPRRRRRSPAPRAGTASPSSWRRRCSSR